jgi:WD40 repeat protein
LAGILDWANGFALSPDGGILATAFCKEHSDSGSCNLAQIQLTDLASLQPLGEPLQADIQDVSGLAFSPDGKRLASLSRDDRLFLWDLAPRRPIAQGEPLTNSNDAASLAFSPDGRILMTGSDDGVILFRDARTLQGIGSALRGYARGVKGQAFSPDGKILVSIMSKCIHLWDSATHQPIGGCLAGHRDSVIGSVFSPDGAVLASADQSGELILWDMNPQSWTDHTCQIAGRNLTLSEWLQFFPDQEYRETCPQWP